MYVQRSLKKTFHDSIQQFPAVLITGPRQSGKTTFLQHELAQSAYLSLDDPLNRDFARQDPNGFLDQFPRKQVILDEIQYVPEILPYIKMRIDRDRSPGKWILTGSQQFHLMKDVTESLAGRLAVLELVPFSLDELSDSQYLLQDILWTGLFPEPSCYPEKRNLWLKSFIQTYVERDIRQLEAVRDYRSFEMFVNLCAAFHAQEFRPAKLAGECGVSQPTIASWSKLLETSYMTVMLPPFFKNYGKRIIKAPKLYYMDPAVVCFLTRQPSPESSLRGGFGGPLFEGLVISEAFKSFFNVGQKPSIFFWRSQSGLEVDLIIQARGLLWPVEIKLTATPSANHIRPIEKFKKTAGKEASEQGILVCRVKETTPLPGKNRAISWKAFSGWLKNLIQT
jgi:predicted AAA+ superfamily ATPase